MRILIYFIKKLFINDYIKLEKALIDPKRAQKETLQNILKNTKHDYESFTKLPLRDFDSYKNIDQLTLNRPKFYELTSGSSGAKKKIPYTSELINDFTNMFKIWAYDLLTYGPNFTGGKVYFSISPQFVYKTAINDDSDYLSGLTGFLFKFFILVPETIKKVKDPEEFKKITCMYLISAKKLEVISIWSPSFFIMLLDTILEHQHEIESALIERQYTWKNLTFKFPKTANFKLHELRKPNIEFANLFPKLKLISAWGALNAKNDFNWLKKTFPNSLVQEKGILATEAVISIPSVKYGNFIPAITQTYFEFLDHENNLFQIDELEIGKTYEIIISQSSGLLRYRLGDMIKVTSLAQNTPCFDFLGRAGNISDLVGEKINEQFLSQLLEENSLPFCIFIPSLRTKRYFCFSEYKIEASLLDKLMSKNPHYLNALKLGQLNSIQVYEINNLSTKIKDFFVSERNMKQGDIKDQILFSKKGESELIDFLIEN